ncbi:MAG: S-layer homology domain-containing protein, partial [Clostridiales bacterium]|nr:S-layer homology domain-containing protein [Clostridiales bacterium]
VEGYEDGEFRPRNTITRQEIALILQRFARSEGVALPNRQVSRFNDEDSIANWAYDAVKELQRAGIINGDDYGNMNPLGNAKRAEAAKLLFELMRIMGLL